MADVQLSLQTIQDYDPAIAATFNKLLKIAAMDCDDRPADDKAREVTLKVVMTPIFDANTRDCDGIEVDFQCGGKSPAHRSRPYPLNLRKNGVMVGNPDSPENPNQSTFMTNDEE